MNLMIEQKENYSWVTQAGLHGLTLEGLELYKIEYFFFNKTSYFYFITFILYQKYMSSKFFGNRTEKHSLNKKGGKQKFNNKSNKAKSAGVRKVGRGG